MFTNLKRLELEGHLEPDRHRDLPDALLVGLVVLRVVGRFQLPRLHHQLSATDSWRFKKMFTKVLEKKNMKGCFAQRCTNRTFCIVATPWGHLLNDKVLRRLPNKEAQHPMGFKLTTPWSWDHCAITVVSTTNICPSTALLSSTWSLLWMICASLERWWARDTARPFTRN